MKWLSQEARVQIKVDRGSGMSITDLVKKYKRGKTTIWHHIQGVELSPEKEEILRSRKGMSKKRSRDEWLSAEEEAKKILKDSSSRKSWYTFFTALYWAEGTKSSFVFTNTDPEMIRIILIFLKDYLNISNERIDVMIRTSVPMKPDECQKYWAGVTRFPLGQIRINHNDQHNKSKTTYGMCRITVRRGAYSLKLFYCLKKRIVATMLR
jgi:hypothetical protein